MRPHVYVLSMFAAVASPHLAGGFSYVGCFKDCAKGFGPSSRAMPHNAGNIPTANSPAACSAKCPGWEFFAVQDGQDCYCGNGHGYSSQGPSADCNMPCTGNRSVTCGGPCANSVYYNRAGPTPPPPPPPPPAPRWPPLPPIGCETDPSEHDIVWTTPSTSGARGALPLGSGECSASVWVEPNGDVLVYVVKSDSFDELTSRDKLARVRVRMEPPLCPTGAAFSQRLVLRNASVVITGGPQQRSLVLFVDASAAALRLQASSSEAAFSLSATLEVWRVSPAPAQGSFCPSPFPGGWNRSADVLLPASALYGAAAVAVAHANPSATADALVSDTLRRQGIDMGGQPVYNPMRGRTFGAWVSSGGGSAMTRVNATTLASAGPAADHTLMITMLTTVAPTPAPDTREAAIKAWAKAAATLAQTQAATSYESAAELHSAEWARLWNRSYVHVSTPVLVHHQAGDGDVTGDPTALLTLQRYLDLANGRGSLYPVHGGGQAWGADGVGQDPATSNTTCTGPPANSGACNPDDYQWWTYYWQEGRHPYYSALPAGDGADMLPALYRVYRDTIPLHAARVRSWWNHSGAVFPERFYLFGPIDSPTYGCSTPPASPDLATGLYQKYHIMGSLALCNLGLDDWQYHHIMGGDGAAAEAAARERMRDFVMPICLNVTAFYHEHYRLDGEGKLDLFPSQAEETWQCPQPHSRDDCVTNPSSDIAGLWAITTRMLSADFGIRELLSSADLAALTVLRQRIPPLPHGPRPYPPNPTLEDVYLPALRVPPISSNAENVELHAVFPFRLTHFGEPDESLMNMTRAKRTFAQRPFPCHANTNWCEDGNVAALLGLADEAATDVMSAVSSSLLHQATVPGWRFPSWRSGGGDTVPCMMPQSILRQTLHNMLLQHTEAGQILLFPAWPSDWEVAFKLHAPQDTIVSARCTNGSISNLVVTPASRRGDVRVLGCNS